VNVAPHANEITGASLDALALLGVYNRALVRRQLAARRARQRSLRRMSTSPAHRQTTKLSAQGDERS
jgi:hypothetical protein